ncbi:MAG: phosphoserine aminotransferase, partial [Rhizobiales bacterium]|nr:phosphoserine aminotransferase [Hyphomicrobiales bacterium]
FEGATINTPSILCVEDYIASLRWAQSVGGLDGLIARADANADAIADWVAQRSWIEHLAQDTAQRSNTSVCLKLSDTAVAELSSDQATSLPKQMAKLLEQEGVAHDIGAYRDAPPGLRIWCGATVETADVAALLPWLDWAYVQASAELS